MANAYTERVNRTVSYRTSTSWRPGRIIAVTPADPDAIPDPIPTLVDILDADGVTVYEDVPRRTNPVNPAPVGTWRP